MKGDDGDPDQLAVETGSEDAAKPVIFDQSLRRTLQSLSGQRDVVLLQLRAQQLEDRCQIRASRCHDLEHYFAAAGKAGSLSMSRGSCWMITVAFRFFAICLKRSNEASVSARLKLKVGTPFDS